jgi:molecular chaperone HtpG
MISLLGRHLYSGPKVFVRELIQNGVDAITARADDAAPEPSWGIRIYGSFGAGQAVRCVDDGIGMTLAQARDVLSTVGRSSKRDDYELPVSGYLGQFGIGLLSCFMVTDKVIVRTRCAGSPAVEWTGYSSGVFTAIEIDDDLPVGTTIEFIPRPDEAALTSPASLRGLCTEYAQYLSIPIEVDGHRINTTAIWADPKHADPHALSEVGTETIGLPPLAAVPLSVPGTDLAGTAFILPFQPSPSARQAHEVYLGRMLINKWCDNLLPDWAFFAHCIVTTTHVNPTASREQFIEDDALEHVRSGLGAALRRWVEATAQHDPALFAEFVSVHHLGLRSVAVHDPELASLIVPWLPFETSVGRMSLRDFVRRWPTVRYLTDADEFDTASTLASEDAPVLNAGYVYDAALIRDLPLAIAGVEVVKVTVSDLLESLALPALADQQLTGELEKRATSALAMVDCEALVRVFDPAEVTSFVVSDPQLWQRLERSRAAATGLWSSMIAALDEAAPAAPAPGPAHKLCLNWASPTIRRLARLTDDVVATRMIRVSYCQAVLAAHRPLNATERELLATSLDDLMALSMQAES